MTTAEAVAPVPARSVPQSGWLVVAAKELADHVLSVRFFVLLIVLGLAAGIPLFLATERIHELASQVSGAQAVFLALFIIGPQDVSIFGLDVSVQGFIGLAAPLLGIAFAFDAVNGERAQGTLPRLVAQPIHRDDVINGKFVASLAAITMVLLSVVLLISGFGLLRLGIVPAWSEVLRLIVWFVVTIAYVAVWLAFGLLLSVIVHRAATAALIGFGVWMAIAMFGRFLLSLVLGAIAPVTDSTAIDRALGLYQLHAFVLRLLPTTLYSEASSVLLNPSLTGTNTPATLGQLTQAQQQIPTLLSLDQSLLLVWPHVVALVALTVICFAIGYIQFMRQEVRA
ncbi:MAG TPA: ABC transporter permease subunit [Candidatus Limnocylindria bacterium]|jgi:ABC-2 type transport system permease protein|nr:ABC transporter permease subunit [Candidatus Limnocylindria bacterium]